MFDYNSSVWCKSSHTSKDSFIYDLTKICKIALLKFQDFQDKVSLINVCIQMSSYYYVRKYMYCVKAGHSNDHHYNQQAGRKHWNPIACNLLTVFDSFERPCRIVFWDTCHGGVLSGVGWILWIIWHLFKAIVQPFRMTWVEVQLYKARYVINYSQFQADTTFLRHGIGNRCCWRDAHC